MILQVKLTNFRKHVSLNLDFSLGLQVIKGANEVGKSTLYESIAYAFYGARALRESLADTVTWGQPEGALRVVVNFEFDGVRYNLYRAKSGCELTYDGGKVTGQSDVTRFIETLFGANADTASRLMMVGQNDLRGSLTAGPTATVELIERLAGFSLLDDIIQKIQEQLPSGPTTVAASRLADATAAVEAYVAPVEPVLDPLPAEKLADQEEVVQGIRETYAKIDVVALRAEVDASIAQARGVEAAAARAETLRKETAHVPVAPETSEAQIAEWEATARDAVTAAHRWQEYTKPVPAAKVDWEGDVASFEKDYAALKQALPLRVTQLSNLTQARREALLIKINETNCAFCKKSLADVPEVAQINSAQDDKIAALDITIAELSTTIAQQKTELAMMDELKSVDDRIRRTFSTELFTFSDTVPTVPTWKGAPPVQPDGTDWAAWARTARKAWQDYNRAVTVREGKLADLAEAERLAALPVADVAVQQAELVRATAVRLELTLAEAKVVDLRHAVSLAEQAYRNALALYESSKGLLAVLTEARDKAHTDLTEVTVHNDLIKKIRAARPIVAATLWGSVLAAISHYFTEVRGEKSVVTRSSNGFRVNSHGVAGLSGSALDSLGLAIRLALTKTFLPNIDFLLLDEPAAACTDERETNMLGVVVTAGFEQVLLVTHSDLSDSFAANLIQM